MQVLDHPLNLFDALDDIVTVETENVSAKHKKARTPKAAKTIVPKAGYDNRAKKIWRNKSESFYACVKAEVINDPNARFAMVEDTNGYQVEHFLKNGWPIDKLVAVNRDPKAVAEIKARFPGLDVRLCDAGDLAMVLRSQQLNLRGYCIDTCCGAPAMAAQVGKTLANLIEPHGFVLGINVSVGHFAVGQHTRKGNFGSPTVARVFNDGQVIDALTSNFQHTVGATHQYQGIKEDGSKGQQMAWVGVQYKGRGMPLIAIEGEFLDDMAAERLEILETAFLDGTLPARTLKAISKSGDPDTEIAFLVACWRAKQIPKTGTSAVDHLKANLTPCELRRFADRLTYGVVAQASMRIKELEGKAPQPGVSPIWAV